MTNTSGGGQGPGRTPRPTARLMGYGASAALLAAVLRTIRRRRKDDPVHAGGHRHRSAPAAEPAPAASPQPQGARDQPWVRRSHSDSQQRRFRR